MLLPGIALSFGHARSKIRVRVGQVEVTATAATEINSREVIVAYVPESDSYLVWGNSSPRESGVTQRRIQRRRPRKKKERTKLFPVKLLALIENEETNNYEFWLYGDEKKPKLIYQVTRDQYDFESSKVIKTGKRNQWEVFIKLIDYDSDSQYHPSFQGKIESLIEGNATYQCVFISSDGIDNPSVYSEQTGEHRNTQLLEAVGWTAGVDPYFWFDAHSGVRRIDFYSAFVAAGLGDLESAFLNTVFLGPSSLSINRNQVVGTQWLSLGGNNYPLLKALTPEGYQEVTRQFDLYTPTEFNTIASYSQIFSTTILKAPTPFLESFDFSSYAHDTVYQRLDSFGIGSFEGAIAVSTPESFAITANQYLYRVEGYSRLGECHSPTLALVSASNDTNYLDFINYPQYNFSYGYPSFSGFRLYRDSGDQYLGEVGFPGTNYNIGLDGNYDPNNYNIYKFIPQELFNRQANNILGWRQLLLTVNETAYFDRSDVPMRSIPDGIASNSLKFELYDYPNEFNINYYFDILFSTGKGNILIHSPLVDKNNYLENSIITTYSYSDVNLGDNQRRDKVIRLSPDSEVLINILDSTYPFKLNVLSEFSSNDYCYLDISIPFLFLQGKTTYIIGVLEGKTYGEIPLTYDYVTRYYLHFNDTITEIIDYSEIEGDRHLYYDGGDQPETFKFIDIPIQFSSLIGNKIYVIDTDDPNLDNVTAHCNKINLLRTR